MANAPAASEFAGVEQLYAEYCESLDDADIERWPSFFVEDASYKITTRDNFERGFPLCFVLCEGQAMLRDRAAALKMTVFQRKRYQRRIVSGIRLRSLVGSGVDGVDMSASFLLYESVGDEPTALLASGRSLDRVVRIGEQLKFKERVCVVDSRLIPDSLVLPI